MVKSPHSQALSSNAYPESNRSNYYYWNQHVLRMPENRLPRKALQYRSLGKRDLGTPRRRWKDQFM